MSHQIASIAALAAAKSNATDEYVVLFKSQNDGGSLRYQSFRCLGEDIMNELAEEDVAFATYPADGNEMRERLSELRIEMEDAQLISIDVQVFLAGERIEEL